MKGDEPIDESAGASSQGSPAAADHIKVSARPSGTPRRTRRTYRHLVPATVVAVAAVALSITVWQAARVSLLATFNRPLVERFMATQSVTSAQRKELAEVELTPAPTPNEALLTYHVDRISLTDRKVYGSVVVYVPPQMLAVFVDRRTGSPIPPAELNQATEYRDKQISAVMFASGENPHTVGQSISQFVYYPASHLAGLGGLLGAISFPISGAVTSFPQDSYSASVIAAVALPDPIVYRTGGQDLRFLPVHVVATQDAGLADYDITYDIFLSGAPASSPSLLMRLTRSNWSRAFIYSMALVPLFIALVLAHLVWLRATKIDTMLGLLFGAVLTILPLRAVLVPAEIGSATLIDSLLGSELMVLLLVGVAGYWRYILGLRSTGAGIDPAATGE